MNISSELMMPLNDIAAAMIQMLPCRRLMMPLGEWDLAQKVWESRRNLSRSFPKERQARKARVRRKGLLLTQEVAADLSLQEQAELLAVDLNHQEGAELCL